MILVDTNIIGYLFLSSEHALAVEKALKKDSEWAAPILWRSEFRNVLAFYLRKKLITLQQAQQIMHGALELMRGREYEVSTYEVLRLVSESRCSAYDCEFIAIANDLNAHLVTLDKQLLHEFPSVAVALNAFIG